MRLEALTHALTGESAIRDFLDIAGSALQQIEQRYLIQTADFRQRYRV